MESVVVRFAFSIPKRGRNNNPGDGDVAAFVNGDGPESQLAKSRQSRLL
jgi:hypothetical protein